MCHIHICLCICVQFCRMVVHILSKDMIYGAKLNRSNICEIIKLCAKIARNWKIFVVFTFEDRMV